MARSVSNCHLLGYPRNLDLQRTEVFLGIHSGFDGNDSDKRNLYHSSRCVRRCRLSRFGAASTNAGGAFLATGRCKRKRCKPGRCKPESCKERCKPGRCKQSPSSRGPPAAANAAPCSTYYRGDFGGSDVDHFLLFRELSLLEGSGRALPDISSMDQDSGRRGWTRQA